MGGIPANKKLFGEVLEADHLSHTMLPENAFTRGMPSHGAHLADELEAVVERYGADTIAAVIVEPMGGSAGVLPPPKVICSACENSAINIMCYLFLMR